MHIKKPIPFLLLEWRNWEDETDVVLWLQVATASQFFISYTIRTFGALTFATIMTTRQVLRNSLRVRKNCLLPSKLKLWYLIKFV